MLIPFSNVDILAEAEVPHAVEAGAGNYSVKSIKPSDSSQGPDATLGLSQVVSTIIDLQPGHIIKLLLTTEDIAKAAQNLTNSLPKQNSKRIPEYIQNSSPYLIEGCVRYGLEMLEQKFVDVQNNSTSVAAVTKPETTTNVQVEKKVELVPEPVRTPLQRGAYFMPGPGGSLMPPPIIQPSPYLNRNVSTISPTGGYTKSTNKSNMHDNMVMKNSMNIIKPTISNDQKFHFASTSNNSTVKTVFHRIPSFRTGYPHPTSIIHPSARNILHQYSDLLRCDYVTVSLIGDYDTARVEAFGCELVPGIEYMVPPHMSTTIFSLQSAHVRLTLYSLVLRTAQQKQHVLLQAQHADLSLAHAKLASSLFTFTLLSTGNFYYTDDSLHELAGCPQWSNFTNKAPIYIESLLDFVIARSQMLTTGLTLPPPNNGAEILQSAIVTAIVPPESKDDSEQDYIADEWHSFDSWGAFASGGIKRLKQKNKLILKKPQRLNYDMSRKPTRLLKFSYNKDNSLVKKCKPINFLSSETISHDIELHSYDAVHDYNDKGESFSDIIPESGENTSEILTTDHKRLEEDNEKYRSNYSGTLDNSLQFHLKPPMVFSKPLSVTVPTERNRFFLYGPIERGIEATRDFLIGIGNRRRTNGAAGSCDSDSPPVPSSTEQGSALPTLETTLQEIAAHTCVFMLQLDPIAVTAYGAPGTLSFTLTHVDPQQRYPAIDIQLPFAHLTPESQPRVYLRCAARLAQLVNLELEKWYSTYHSNSLVTPLVIAQLPPGHELAVALAHIFKPTALIVPNLSLTPIETVALNSLNIPIIEFPALPEFACVGPNQLVNELRQKFQGIRLTHYHFGLSNALPHVKVRLESCEVYKWSHTAETLEWNGSPKELACRLIGVLRKPHKSVRSIELMEFLGYLVVTDVRDGVLEAVCPGPIPSTGVALLVTSLTYPTELINPITTN